jgi:hypothetical protein
MCRATPLTNSTVRRVANVCLHDGLLRTELGSTSEEIVATRTELQILKMSYANFFGGFLVVSIFKPTFRVHYEIGKFLLK